MFNRVIIVGRIATEPKIRGTNGDVPVLTFRLAIDKCRVKKGENGEKHKTCFLNVAACCDETKFIRGHFKKSDRIMVEGKLRESYYNTQNGGGIRHEFVAESLSFMGDKKRAPTPFVQISEITNSPDLDDDRVS